eukprot:7304512-Ditylum_brightwellii.AAC.1
MTDHDITLWDTFLNIDGILLELLKLAHAMLVWKFNTNGIPEITQAFDLPPMQYRILKSLGVPTALDLNNEALIQHIMKRTKQYARAITACPLPQQE